MDLRPPQEDPDRARYLLVFAQVDAQETRRILGVVATRVMP